jgi:cation diffusion facilitator family transporter
VFAVVLWVFVAIDPGVVLIVGASLTTSRAVTGFLVAAGVLLSRRHTRSFPEGFYKLENLLALVIGLLIAFGAYELGRYAVSAAVDGSDLIPYPGQSLVFIGVATALSLVLGVYKLRVARAQGCVALRADAGHSFVDFAAGGVLCAGLALDIAGVPIADSVAAAIVSVCILWAGGSIVYQAVRVLLDASVERSVLDEVREIAAADPGVSEVLDVSGRNSGSFRFLTLRLVTTTDQVTQAEDVAARVKTAIRARVRNVDEVVVELAEASAAASPGTAAVVSAAPASAPAAAAAAASPSSATGPPSGLPTPHHGRLHLQPTEWAEVVSVFASAAMAATMIAVAAGAGSVAVLAEGTDSLTDVVTSLVVLAGMRLAARHTRGFPQGLYKLENFIAVGIGVLVLISAYELAREAVARIVSGGDEIEGPLLVIVVMLGVMAAKVGLAVYKSRVGKANGSPSLQADARATWTDVFASAGVAVGVGLQWAGIPYMDSVAALVVAALLAWSGVQVLRDGLRVLLDASLEQDVLEQVRACAESQPGVRRVAAVLGRNAGSYRFVTLRIVPAEAGLAEAEHTAGQVTAAVRTSVARIDRVSVELVAG